MNARAVSFLDRALAALPLFCAVALPLGFYLKTYDPVLIKEVTLQAAAALAAALWLSRALEAGRFELPCGREGVAGAAAAALAWTFLSFSWNAYPAVSLFPALRQAALLALFLAALTGPASVGWALALADWTLAGVGAAALYALLQRSGLDPAPWRDALSGSAFSTLGGPAALGALAAAAWPLALARASDPESGPARRAAAAAAGALAFAAVWASSTTAGLLALAAGSAAFAARVLSSAGDGRLRTLALGQTAAVAAAAAAFPWAVQDERWHAARRALASAWRGAWDMALFKPLTGWGAGSFAAVFPDFRPPELARWAANAAQLTQPRSEPLRVAAELGLIGVVLFALLGALILIPAWRDAGERLRKGDARGGGLAASLWASALALAAAGCMSDALASPAPAFLLAMASAALAALPREAGSAVVHVLPIPAPPLARLALARLAALGAVAMLLVPAAFWAADLKLNAAVARGARGDVSGAAAELRRLWLRHPRGGAARYYAARLLAKRNQAGDAEAALAIFRELEPHDPGLPGLFLKRAETEIRLADWRGAERSLQRGLKLEPGAAESWERLIEVEWILGKKEEARRAALALVRLEPNNPERWRSLAQAYRQLNRPKVARLMDRHAARVGELARSGSLPPVY